jgi:hypothetical protein
MPQMTPEDSSALERSAETIRHAFAKCMRQTFGFVASKISSRVTGDPMPYFDAGRRVGVLSARAGGSALLPRLAPGR